MKTSTMYVVSTSVSPRFTNITGNTEMNANGVNKLKFTCSTDSANPAYAILWYRDGKPVTSIMEVKHEIGENGGLVTSQVLEFVPSRGMDGQTVECKALNELSAIVLASSSVTLDLRCKFISLDPNGFVSFY